MSNSQKVVEAAGGWAFQVRVRYFLIKAAIAVMSELGTTTNHAERLIYARKVMDGSANLAIAAIAVATNATVSTTLAADNEPTDNDLEFTVNSMFTAFSL